jgi:hypothetical protein
MTKQQPIQQIYAKSKRMEQAGWEPLLAPIPILSPPHHRLAPLLAYLFTGAAIAALILVLLHLASASLL